MTASKILLYFCLSFIGGIFLNSFFIPSIIFLWLGLTSGLILISIFWQYKKAVIIGFCLLFLVFGIWRYQIAELGIKNNELRKFNDLEQEVALVGTIAKEPDIREKSIKLTIKVKEISHENTSRQIEARVLVTTWRYPEYQYGDKLKITGKLEAPKIFEDFNYKDYLFKEGIYSVVNFPKIELIEKNQGNFIYAKIFNLKNKLRESIYQNLSPPQSSILGAMILGDKRKISEDLKQKLNIAGVRHITAISGMHIMILSGVLMYLGIALGLYRGQAFYFAITLLSLFIIMVGAPASAQRAGIMGGLFLLGQKLGRLSSSSRVIVMAATVMLAANPLLLKSDVGFQLSFLAVMGIIYLMPIFRNWISSPPPKNVKKFVYHLYNFRYYFFSVILLKNPALQNIAAMTLSAQVFTLPILIYNFGRISLIAPITNILIVPLLPAVMVSGFIFGLSGIIFQPLGFVLSWPTWLLLTYLAKIVDWFSSIPFASLTSGNIHWIWLILSYLILGYFVWRLQEKQKLKFLQY